jgi:hypothetical protein
MKALIVLATIEVIVLAVCLWAWRDANQAKKISSARSKELLRWFE